jgi:RNA polymerase sigma-70 factor (ECF subfamily)
MERVEVDGGAWVEPTVATTDTTVSTDAFALLTRRDVDRAYRLAWAILADEDDAQDATQEALTAAWQQRHSLRDRDRLEAWLGRIVVNKCRDRLRSRARSRNRIRSIDLVALPSVADGSRAAADRDEVGRALETLSPDHRIVVVLRFWADLTVDAIAERLDVPTGTVKSRLHTAMSVLRSTMEATR